MNFSYVALVMIIYLHKKPVLIVLSILIIIIISFLLYLSPIQRYYSDKKFEIYLSSNAISSNNIKSEKVILDYKNGGYVYEVRYKDDPDWNYTYSLPARSLNELKHGKIYTQIYSANKIKIIQHEFSTKAELKKNNLSEPKYK